MPSWLICLAIVVANYMDEILEGIPSYIHPFTDRIGRLLGTRMNKYVHLFAFRHPRLTTPVALGDHHAPLRASDFPPKSS